MNIIEKAVAKLEEELDSEIEAVNSAPAEKAVSAQSVGVAEQKKAERDVRQGEKGEFTNTAGRSQKGSQNNLTETQGTTQKVETGMVDQSIGRTTECNTIP